MKTAKDSPWIEAIERNNLLNLSYKVLTHALKSKKVTQKKKIDISLALVKRRIPQDVNMAHSGEVKIENIKVEFVNGNKD